MSLEEVKKPTALEEKLEECQKEFNQVAFRLGCAEYEMDAKKAECGELKVKMANLSKTGADLQKKLRVEAIQAVTETQEKQNETV